MREIPLLPLPRCGGKTTQLIEALLADQRETMLVVATSNQAHSVHLHRPEVRGRVVSESQLLYKVRGIRDCVLYCDDLDLWQEGVHHPAFHTYEVALATYTMGWTGSRSARSPWPLSNLR